MNYQMSYWGVGYCFVAGIMAMATAFVSAGIDPNVLAMI